MTSGWIRPLLLASLLLAPTASPAADLEFNQIVNRLSDHYQKQPMAGRGFLSFVANCFSPSGVSRLKLAIFQDVNAKPLDGDFESFLKTTAGSGYHPFVTVRSNRKGECVYIYAKEVGKRMELLMVCAERTDAVVMKVRLDPKGMEKWMNEPSLMAKGSAHGSFSH